MKIIAHISDLHFGREDKTAADSLRDDLHREKPSVVVVSGDLTQRARKSEFKAARDFLDSIPFPKVVVPGNHDIPLYSLYGRFIKRLSSFERYISDEFDEVYEDAKLAIFGINSSRSLTFKEGRISHQQLEQLKVGLNGIDPSKLKILVVHHPLPTLGRAGLAIPILEQCGLDMVLTGHLHESSILDLKADLTLSQRSILAIGAGTAISARTRGEPNSYNLIKASGSKISLLLKVLNEGIFSQSGHFAFEKRGGTWCRS
jgi:predicted MPP superfamily phosphohydrolase